MAQYNFNTAYTQARELYGLELKDNQFETLGLIAWDRIGNKQYRLYNYKTTPTKDNEGGYIIELPCNADIIEAVTANYEDYDHTSSTFSFGGSINGGIESFIEEGKKHTNNLYISGKFVKYNREGNILRLAGNFSPVNILYKGVIVDEEGLPFLSSKELDAIAAFCAYSSTFKDALVNKDSAGMQMSQILEQKWKSLCTQARIPEYLNQNDMDEILNVSASWDRKRFGKSFKPIR